MCSARAAVRPIDDALSQLWSSSWATFETAISGPGRHRGVTEIGNGRKHRKEHNRKPFISKGFGDCGNSPETHGNSFPEIPNQ